MLIFGGTNENFPLLPKENSSSSLKIKLREPVVKFLVASGNCWLVPSEFGRGQW